MPPVPPARSRRSLLFDLAICLGVALLTLLTLRTERSAVLPREIWGAAMAVALFWRRRHPVPVIAAVATFALAQVFTVGPDGPLPYDVAVLVAMYSVVKYTDRMRWAYVAAGVVAAGAAIEVAFTPSRFWYLLAIWYVGICGSTWLAAYTVRNRRIYVAGLEERAATLEREREHLARIAVAEERATIARELHDVVAHSLAVMIVQAAGGTYAFDRTPERAREALATIAATGRDALEDMRRLVTVLRGDADGTESRRRVGVAELTTLLAGARQAGLTIDADISVAAGIPPAVELTLYRVVQEALTNVLRHAGPEAKVTVRLTHEDGTVRMDIRDDGGGIVGGVGGADPKGKRPEAAPRTPGHGVAGMRERIDVHGGTFHAGPRFDGGWQILAEVPCAS